MTKKSLMIASAVILPLTVGVMAMGIGVSNMNNNGYSPIKATVLSDYSVTFTRENSYSAAGTTYTYEQTTTNGNKIYLVSTGGTSRASGAIAQIPSAMDTATNPTFLFYKTNDASKAFRHQLINNVNVKTSRDVELSVLTSSDGYTFRQKGTFSCGTSGGTFSDFNEYDRFVSISVSERANQFSNITEITINYGCESITELPFVAGHYRAVVKDNSNRDSEINLFMNSDNYGYYTFYNNTDLKNYYTLFTWNYDSDLKVVTVSYTGTPAGSISDLAASGNTAAYQGYRLFEKFSKDDIKSNYIALFDNEVSLFFHTAQASYTNQYQRATVTIMTLVA